MKGCCPCSALTIYWKLPANFLLTLGIWICSGLWSWGRKKRRVFQLVWSCRIIVLCFTPLLIDLIKMIGFTINMISINSYPIPSCVLSCHRRTTSWHSTDTRWRRAQTASGVRWGWAKGCTCGRCTGQPGSGAPTPS